MNELNSPNKDSIVIHTKQENRSTLKDILKNKSFMLVLSGQLMNTLASVLVGMTFSYLIFEITQNAALMVFLSIMGSLPTILLIIFTGVLIDRFDQRKLMFMSIILRLIVFVIFLLCFLLRNYLIQDYFITQIISNDKTLILHIIDYTHFIWPMYAALFLSNLGSSLYYVTTRTYTKYIIKKQDYLVVNSLNAITLQISSIISPILAGLVISFSYLYSFIIGVCLICLAVVFCSLLVLKGLKPPKIERKKASGFKNHLKDVFGDIRVGMQSIKSEPKILYITVVYVVFNFATSAKYSLYNVILQGEMELSAFWIGIIGGITGGISVLSSLVIMRIGKIKRKLLLVNFVVALDAIGILLFAFNRNLLIMVSIIVIPFGMVSGLANIPTQTLRKEKIPHEKLGRVLSSVFLFISIANLVSASIIMIISNIVNPMYIILGGGILCSILFIVSFIVYLSKESLRCSDYIEEQEPQKKVQISRVTPGKATGAE